MIPSELRQRYFGVNFTLLNLGIGIGGLVGGLLRRRRPAADLPGDLPRRRRQLPARALPAARAAAPRRRPARPRRRRRRRRRRATSTVLRQPAVASLLVLSFVSSFVGYSQLNAGMPAYARVGRRDLDPGARLRVRRQHAGDRAAPARRAAADRGPPAHPGHRGDGRGLGGVVAAARRHRAGARHLGAPPCSWPRARRSSRSARRCCSRRSRRWSTTSRPTTCAGATTPRARRPSSWRRSSRRRSRAS